MENVFFLPPLLPPNTEINQSLNLWSDIKSVTFHESYIVTELNIPNLKKSLLPTLSEDVSGRIEETQEKIGI